MFSLTSKEISDVLMYVKLLPVQVQRRASLPPPAPPDITWEEYVSSPAGKPPLLGREQVRKSSSKHFKATLAMVSSFEFCDCHLFLLLSLFKVKTLVVCLFKQYSPLLV